MPALAGMCDAKPQESLKQKRNGMVSSGTSTSSSAWPRIVASTKKFGACARGWRLTLPYVGIAYGVGLQSAPGAGFSLGGSVSYAWTPRWSFRLSLHGTQTSQARVRIRFLEEGLPVQSQERATWLSLGGRAGIDYSWRDAAHLWEPYVGLEAGLASSGYRFALGSKIRSLQTVDIAQQVAAPQSDSIGLEWTVGVRVGMRKLWSLWLASVWEFSLTYTSVSDRVLTNTRQARDVRADTQGLFLFRLGSAFEFGW